MGMTKMMLEEIPAAVVPEALEKIDKFNGMRIPQSRDALASAFYETLRNEFSEAELAEELKRLHMSSKREFLSTVDTYIAMRRSYPNIAFHNEYLSRPSLDVSDTTFFLIDSVVKTTKITDRYDVMSEICAILETKFGDGKRLESNLVKLNLRTTKDILHAIDMYFIMLKLYPDTVFGRDRMRRVWGDSIARTLEGKEVS